MSFDEPRTCSVSSLGKMLESLLKWLVSSLIRHPRTVACLLGGITLLLLPGIAQVTLAPASEQLFLRHSAAYRIYQRFLSTFGSDETILVALHDPHHTLLRPDGLAAIRQLTLALAEVPQVASVFSITNAPDMAQLTLTPYGIAVPPLLKDDQPSQERIAALQDNELVIGALLARDLRTAGLLVVPNDTIAAPDEREAWIVAVRTIAAQHARHGRQTYVAGTPLERHDVTEYLQRDQQRIIPLVFLVLLAITWRLYAFWRLALIPLACVLLSLAWTMGIVGYTGIPLNLVTSLLPPVIMVVSISTAIHLINQYLTDIETVGQGANAVEIAVGRVGVACCLTSLTTVLGFLSLLASPVPAIQEFAAFAGLGVLLSFLITMTLTPLALLHSGHLTAVHLKHLQEGYSERCLDRLAVWVATHRRLILTGTLVIVGLSLPGVWRLKEGTDIVRALKAHAPLRLSAEFIDQHLAGVNSLEVLIQLPATTSFTTPATLRQILAFTQWLRTQPGVTTVHSPWEALRSVRTELRTRDDQLSVVAALLPMAFPLQAWLDGPGNTLRVSVRVTTMRSDQLLTLAQRLEQHAAQEQLAVQVTGSNFLLAQMSRTLVQTQLRSLVLASLSIFGSIVLVLRSWKLGLLAVPPNFLPPLMIFGLMGWCGIELSTATTMIASVVLGLIVDNTIHLLYRYTRQRAAGAGPSVAIAYALRHTGRAAIFSTLILTFGFWVGVLGSFKPTIHFSLLTGLTMVLALLADLLLTPATILTWDNRS